MSEPKHTAGPWRRRWPIRKRHADSGFSWICKKSIFDSMTVAEFIEYLKTQPQDAEVRCLVYDRSDYVGSYYKFESVDPNENAYVFERDGKSYIDLGKE